MLSISEIMLILIVALIVIKPEQLPEVAHNLGNWIKKIIHLKEKLKKELQNPIKSDFNE